jgi:hypothetical protein
VLPKLKDIYRTATDPGLHGSAEWLLRTWQQEGWLKQVNDEWAKDKGQWEKRLQGIHQLLTKDRGKVPPQWYVNGQGQTMVVIPGPVEFMMGSPPSEAGRKSGAEGRLETQRWEQLDHSYAIASKEVTVEQFLKFWKNHTYENQLAPQADCPMNWLSWYDAVEYCNWLSEEEGISKDQWCYLPNKEGRYFTGMKVVSNYILKTGYRLPTEKEWEYACRAGTVTSRYYGEKEDLSGKYAWFANNSQGWWLLTVGCLKPNDFGLFDMQGNIMEWCQERSAIYETVMAEKEEVITNAFVRVLRGGSFISASASVRSAYKDRDFPISEGDAMGFRPAKTLR